MFKWLDTQIVKLTANALLTRTATVKLKEFSKNLQCITLALEQRFSNCGPRTTSGPRVLPLWSF